MSVSDVWVRACLVLLRAASIAALGLGLAARAAAASPRTPSGPTVHEGHPFAWLVPASAPHDWAEMTTPSGEAALSYPRTFQRVSADPGAVSAAALGSGVAYDAYLNVTPREGDEQLKGFARFRVAVLRDEDTSVHLDVAAEGLRFNGNRSSCVMDDYRTRVGGHNYQEMACLVIGKRGADVIVAAAPLRRWRQFAPGLRRAFQSFKFR